MQKDDTKTTEITLRIFNNMIIYQPDFIYLAVMRLDTMTYKYIHTVSSIQTKTGLSASCTIPWL